MRVLLINVRDPQFYAVQRGQRAKSGNPIIMGFPPIGIMSLSAVVKREGHECVMFDQANPDTPDRVILEKIRRWKPDLVGLSFLSTTSYPYAKILARKIREVDTDTKICFGGVFASLNAERVKRQCTEIDYVCRGDGEQVIIDMLANLEDPEKVDGLTWTKPDGEVVMNLSRPLERDLDQWPIPDRESLPVEYVESLPLDVPVILSMERFTTVQTSRGCPFPCVFCDIPTFNGGGKWRCRSPEHVITELKHLEEQGYGSALFVDDNFLLMPKRIEKICKLYIEAGLTIRWACEGRVDSVARHLFPLMAQANCRTVMFGIEGGTQKILDRLKKGQTLEQIETAVHAAKEAGIELVHGFFVVGSPDETAEDMAKTFDFAARIPIDTFGFNRLCVYRGTPLWHEYISRGLLSDEEDWYKYFKCSEIDPTCLSGPQINDIRAKGLKRLFRYKLRHYPKQTFALLRRFFRHMPLRDIAYLIAKPFLGQKSGATKAELLSRAVEHKEMKDAAADLTRIDDEELKKIAAGNRLPNAAEPVAEEAATAAE